MRLHASSSLLGNRSLASVLFRRFLAIELMFFSKTMAKIISIVFVVLIALMLSNPSKQDHLEALSEKNALRGGLVRFGALIGGVEYNNYIVASTLSIDGSALTIGLFKNVIVLNKNDSL
jgi:hypothetical protein